MSTIFILKKEPQKKPTNFSLFLKGCYFVMGASIDMKKSLFLQLFPKYSQSYANLNVKSRPNLNALENRQVFLVFSIEM